jgi:quaternary ammonium compound-resistance protein SugE
MNSWILLVIAGLLEVCWALALKASHAFTRPMPTLWFAISLAASMVLLAQAIKTLPVGTAYAVWVGIGAAGAAIAAVFLQGEAMTWPRALFLGLLIISIIGLKVTSTPA